MAALSPATALSAEGFYSLYLGGLAIDDEQRRRDACYVLLLMGRLGLRPAEIGHLHDGWIDWARGDLHVPAHDPCACRNCWETASERSQDTDRSVEEQLQAECWSPPEGPDGARSIAFGWSRRLTAVIDGVLGDRQYLDADPEAIAALVDEATENAWELDRESVSIDAIRSSAGVFLATAGFGPRRLAELLVIDEETAGAFARIGGGELRNHLYRALPQANQPEICRGDSAYRLVCDPTPFEREPFDPRTHDARWRADRAEQSTKRGRNPRPAVAPDGSSFDPASDLGQRETTADSGSQLVSESLADWVQRRESQRTQYAETGRAGMEMADEEPAAYRDYVTAPVKFSLSTRFAGQGIENGRPTGGSLVLGQRELVLVSRDETGIADLLRVPFSSILDIAPDYVPGPLEGIFDTTVGVQYRDGEDRKVIVCELPENFAWDFQETIFCSLLDEIEVVYANLSEGPDDPTEIEADHRVLTASPRSIKIADPESDGLPVRIRLATIVGIDEKPMECEVGYEMGLTLHHLRVNANVVTTELRATDDRAATFLKRFLIEHHKRQTVKARNASLSTEQLAVLDALHDTEDGRDLVAILDMNPSRVSTVVSSLKELGLVRDSRTGVALTGTGYLVTSGGSLLYEEQS